MKKALTCLLLFLGLACSAQNYNCFVPGKRQYFINNNNYLRGIRIDSVIADGTDTIYYPFHTPRGNYVINDYFNKYYLDSTGGSWVGKKVIKQQDGTFLFDNLWGDTIVIKTQANIGDTWSFYNDTSNRYYMASIASLDTMTIDGNLDSTKTISITAYQNGNINYGDSINNTGLILSKTNGFIQILDLYTFPYHSADTPSYRVNSDYYLDYLMKYSGPSIKGLNFHCLSLINPTYQQLYNWNPGDIYEYRARPRIYTFDNYTFFYIDTIRNKSIMPSNTLYDFNGLTIIPSPYYSYNYVTANASGTLNATNAFLIDTVLMPEEYKQGTFIYYYPMDTTYCVNSPAYNILPKNIFSNFYQNIPFVNVEKNMYKIGLGRVVFDSYIYSPDWGTTMNVDTSLIFWHQDNVSCGSYYSVGIDKIPYETNTISLFPNPATNDLNISFSNTTHTTYSICLINTLGQSIQTIRTTEEQTSINVSNLPNGLYNVIITDEDGRRINEKVIVDH